MIHLLWEHILKEVVEVPDSHSYQVYRKCISQQNRKSKQHPRQIWSLNFLQRLMNGQRGQQ
jgi:hypothetical protein